MSGPAVVLTLAALLRRQDHRRPVSDAPRCARQAPEVDEWSCLGVSSMGTLAGGQVGVCPSSDPSSGHGVVGGMPPNQLVRAYAPWKPIPADSEKLASCSNAVFSTRLEYYLLRTWQDLREPQISGQSCLSFHVFRAGLAEPAQVRRDIGRNSGPIGQRQPKCGRIHGKLGLTYIEHGAKMFPSFRLLADFAPNMAHIGEIHRPVCNRCANARPRSNLFSSSFGFVCLNVSTRFHVCMFVCLRVCLRVVG